MVLLTLRLTSWTSCSWIFSYLFSFTQYPSQNPEMLGALQGLLHASLGALQGLDTHHTLLLPWHP